MNDEYPDKWILSQMVGSARKRAAHELRTTASCPFKYIKVKLKMKS